jgi:hypothetical protein
LQANRLQALQLWEWELPIWHQLFLQGKISQFEYAISITYCFFVCRTVRVSCEDSIFYLKMFFTGAQFTHRQLVIIEGYQSYKAMFYS